MGLVVAVTTYTKCIDTSIKKLFCIINNNIINGIMAGDSGQSTGRTSAGTPSSAGDSDQLAGCSGQLMGERGLSPRGRIHKENLQQFLS